MNEQVARDVVLMGAIESADTQYEILSEDDRLYASRSARELAHWQAADGQSAVTLEHFLQQRAEQILKRIAERHSSFAACARRRTAMPALTLGLPLLALCLGAGLDRIGDPHHVDLLSAPLLSIIGWNLLVYLGLLLALLLPAPRPGGRLAPLLRRLSVGRTALPRKLPQALSAALFAFMATWSQLSARLTAARLARAIHLAAAAFALGAMLSLYARGMLSQYVAGWESTFLDAGQVHTLLSLLFAPAEWAFALPGFSVADIEALRFSRTTPATGGALWVHLYAATLLLLVVLPRLSLAAVAGWRSARIARRFPLDLEQPYYRKLSVKLGGAAAVLRVLPYSFTLDEPRDRGLTAVAADMLGEQTRVMLRPPVLYGENLADAALDETGVTRTAALFNLAATPEKENHGVFLDTLARRLPHGAIALLDESPYLERLGAGRLDDRITLWREFCQFHGARAVVVNLLDPQARQLEAEAP